MLKKIVLVFATLALAKAQLPNVGWCPERVAKGDFDINRFLGVWYEAERYFQLSEVVSRCLTSNYSIGPDGKIHVSNEVTNRITGVKRVLDGIIQPSASKADVGKLHVKYTTVPLGPETEYLVLDTDYENFAVLWSCNSFGLVHAQNAWVMTRQRDPSPDVLQRANGVLDQHQFWKRYFVKSDQTNCSFDIPKLPEKPAAAPAPVPIVESPAPVKEPEVPVLEKSAGDVHLRSAVVQLEGEVIDEAKEEETPAQLPDAPTELVEEPVKELPAANVEPAKVVLPEEKLVLAEVKPENEQLKAVAPEVVPEVILKVAQIANEANAAEKPLVNADPIAEESKTVEVAVLAESKPEVIAAVLLPEAAEETPTVVEAAATADSADNSKVEATPIEEPIQSAEQPEPVEAVAEVSKPEIVEIEKPLEVVVEKIELPAAAVLPESPARVVPNEATEEIKIAVVPAVLPESAPVDSSLVKTPEEPQAEEPELVIPESAEPAKIPESDEQILRKVVPAAVPETILEPVVLTDEQPLKAIVVAAEESKIEGIDEAPKTLETKL